MKRLLFFLPLLGFAAAPGFRVASERVVSTQAMAVQSAVFSQDGSRLAYLSDGHLFVTNIATRATRDAGPWSRAGEMLAFAPDGQSMYIGHGDDLYQHSLAGGPFRKIIEHAGSPHLSPDGKTLGFLRFQPPSPRALMLAGADGSHERQLAVVRSPGPIISWAWSADSSQIAVLLWNVARSQSKTFLDVISCDSGDRRHITEWNEFPGSLAWLPDASGFLIARQLGLWHYSIADHAWSQVEGGAGLSGLRRAGPDGWTLAAHRTRVIRDFWDSLVGLAGMSAGRTEDQLVLIKISK